MICLEEIHSVFNQVRHVVSHIEVCLPEKPLNPKIIGEFLTGPQRKFWKEALFVKCDKSKNSSLLLAPIPIKYFPDRTKVLRSLIALSIMEGECSVAWKFVACHCENWSSSIQGIDFDQ